MRVPFLLLLVLSLALTATACAGGPQDSDKRLTEACERQIKEIEDGEDEGDTPTAKSTEERLDEVTLVECAGQETKVVAADETADDGVAPADGDEPAEGEDPTEGEQPAEGGETTTVDLDPEARSLFSETCGSCHALSDAETDGAIGPNLDDTELDSAGVAAKIAAGGGGMPAGLLEGDEATSVADYVAAAAAAG